MKHSPGGDAFTEIVIEAFRLGGLLASEGDRIGATLGLSSSRWKILGAIARSGTALTVPQIAREMGQSRQAVQSLVNIMHGAGLLEFRDNPRHKRAKLVELTESGASAYGQIEALQIPWANEHARELPLEDLRTTLATLRRISERLET